MFFFFDFWIGEGTDLKKYWQAYHEGEGYKQKFLDMKCHVFEITFAQNEINLPLYNLEPIYKTLKAYYHDVKKDCLSPREYQAAGPLFIYEINRKSGIWTWLGELPYLLLYGTTLTAEEIKGKRIDNLEKKLKILKEYFSDSSVRPELFEAFMKASTPEEMEDALQNMFAEKIISVKISRSAVTTSVEDAKKDMIDLKQEFKQLEDGDS